MRLTVMMKRALLVSVGLLGCWALTVRAQSGASADGARDAADLRQFERKAMLSKELGATHLLVTEGLPLATWEMEPNDPYPTWFVHHASMLKIFPPKDVQPYVDMKYAAHVVAQLTQRCAVLKKYDLKGVWNANEPAVMPEAFFAAYPELRGPRIDQPNRSRKVYFAPNVDEPETLRMYRESMQSLLKTCPEVELFTWLTTDAGSGFDWVPALYPGINGNAKWKDRPMSDRVSGFLINAQQAAKDAGHDVQISLRSIAARQWMVTAFPPDVLTEIVRKLPRGLAVEGKEGPDGRRFVTGAVGGGRDEFYPVVGLAVPSMSGGGDAPRNAARVYFNLGDESSMDANFQLLKFTHDLPMRSLPQRITALRAFAASQVGEAQADNLVEAWSALNDAQRDLDVLNFGGMLRFGHVLNRWLTRPMVPFPEQLTDAEKADYRSVIFQAKDEEQAEDLADIQAMRMYEGWGAKLLFQRTIELTVPRVERAKTLIAGIAVAATDAAARQHWELTGKRLQALIYLLQSADNAVAYQAQLDRVKALGAKPEVNPVLGVQSSWDRTDLMETARKEIDTTLALRKLLASTPEPILDFAATPGEAYSMRLGPDTAEQMMRKVATMNAHWRDYDRLFTVPNP